MFNDLQGFLFILLWISCFLLLLLIIFLYNTIDGLDKEIIYYKQFKKRSEFFETRYYGMVEEYQKLAVELHERRKSDEGSETKRKGNTPNQETPN